MTELVYTLLAEGSSDKALMDILRWAIKHRLKDVPVQGHYADLRPLPKAPRKLSERIHAAVDLYPCDLLFVHRDADAALPQQRKQEIRAAYEESGLSSPRMVFVIPVRMTEAWLLLDEDAIRRASGNPNGKEPLELPRDPDQLPNPKDVLGELLKQASGLAGRRRKRFRPEQCTGRIPGFMKEFAILRRLAAFVDFENELERALQPMCG
jgi:hypothetical protein